MESKIFLSVTLLIGTFFWPSTAKAQIVVGENSKARDCYMKAKLDERGRRSSIKACERALAYEPLDKKDRAATQVNMGILLMRRGNYEKSLMAYNGALDINQDLAEAHINRGACLIFLKRYDAAVSALSRSIELDTQHMPDALFNRAIAYESLGKSSLAYKDFKRAAELRPDWVLPTRALENYQIVTKAK